MAEEKQSKEPIVSPTPKPGPVDLTKRVEVTILKGAPYYKEGEVIKVPPARAEKMKANKWAK